MALATRVPGDEEQLLARTAREWARSGGLDAASERDRHDRFPTAELQEAAGLGLLGLAAAGAAESGLPPTAVAYVLDEVAQVDPSLAACMAAHNACLAAAQAHAGAAADARVAALAGGELAALLATEEASGSDTSAVGTTARRDGAGGYRITGQKVWGVNAEAARHLLVLANVVADAGSKELSGPTLFCLSADSAGVSRGRNESLLGLRCAGIRTVYLYDVAASADAVLGTVGGGLAALAPALTALRVGVAACLNGCVAGGLEAAARFAETRVQFQNPIGSYQAVSDGLAAVDMHLAASRSLTLDAAARLGQGDAAVWAARAKAFASQMAIPMTRQSIRVQGGTGFMREGGTERFARDARALQFMGGAVQMQNDVLKRNLMPGIAFPTTP